MLESASFALAFISLVLMLWQWHVARRFPLHRSLSDSSYSPSISILKPLKGVDHHTRDCLRSWLRQHYAGPMQILFGVASREDPACRVVSELCAEFPNADTQLIICDQNLGANGKLSTLAQLEQHIKHDLVVVSDADVMAPPNLIATAVSLLRDPRIGLATCFYRLANPATLAMHWEAVAMNSDFWSQVLQAQSIRPIDFALGAVMATPRARLKSVGGFAALADYLADDYYLGHQIAGQGYRIAICPVVVECWAPPMSWRSVWTHQLRWARTIRISKPAAYLFSGLANPTVWPLAFLLTSQTPAAFIFALACWFLRGWTATDQLRICLGEPPPLLTRVMVWPKDLLQTAIWIGAFLGNQIEWRNETFRVLSNGKLVRQ